MLSRSDSEKYSVGLSLSMLFCEMPEAVFERYSSKEVFLKISQISQEKRYSNTGVFLGNLRNF